MNAHDKTTLRQLRDWFKEYPDDTMLVTPTGASAKAAVLALSAAWDELHDTTALFRIDFNCGCTMRLFREQKPEVTRRRDHPELECDLRRMVFVAE